MPTAAFVVPALLCLLLAILLRPAKSLRAFLFLAPLNYFYVLLFDWQVSWIASGGVSEGAPPLIKYAKDLIFLAILISWAVGVAAKPKQLGRLRLGVVDILVIAYIAYPALLLPMAGATIGFLAAAIAFWQNCGYALAYFMLRSTLLRTDIAELQFWSRLALGLGGSVAAVGIWQFFWGPRTFQYLSGPYEGANRAISTLGSPNGLGMYLGIVLVFAVATGAYRGRRLWVVPLLLIVVCLFLTLSMSSIAATLVGLFLIACRDRRVRVSVAALSLGGFVMALGAGSAVLTRLRLAASGKDESWLLRIENWRELWPSDELRLLVGGGPGTGGAMTVSFFGGGVADNQYLAMVLQFGIIGFLVYVLLLASGAYRGVVASRYARSGHWWPFQLAAGVIVVVVSLFGVVANVMNVFPINLYFWTALAVQARSQEA